MSACADRHSHHTVLNGLMLLALGALLARSWNSCCGTHQRRHANKPEAKPEPVQTWEGEGGQNQQHAPGATAPSPEP